MTLLDLKKLQATCPEDGFLVILLPGGKWAALSSANLRFFMRAKQLCYAGGVFYGEFPEGNCTARSAREVLVLPAETKVVSLKDVEAEREADES